MERRANASSVQPAGPCSACLNTRCPTPPLPQAPAVPMPPPNRSSACPPWEPPRRRRPRPLRSTCSDLRAIARNPPPLLYRHVPTVVPAPWPIFRPSPPSTNPRRRPSQPDRDPLPLNPRMRQQRPASPRPRNPQPRVQNCRHPHPRPSRRFHWTTTKTRWPPSEPRVPLDRPASSPCFMSPCPTQPTPLRS